MFPDASAAGVKGPDFMTCGYCGGMFRRRRKDKESEAEFQRRKYCSQTCAGRARTDKKSRGKPTGEWPSGMHFEDAEVPLGR